jgi:hypothetical protein
MDIGFIANIIIGLVIIFLFFMTYSYIEKLERIGCPCSEHPYRNFIKGFSVFAIIYFLVTMFIPASAVFKTVGPIGSVLYMAFNFVFVILVILYFYLCIQYTHHLIKEKCKCSEDYRREALYYWSIIHMALLVVLILLPYFFVILGSVIALTTSSARYVSNSANEVHSITMNPVKHLKKVPSSLRASAKAAKSLIRKRK